MANKTRIIGIDPGTRVTGYGVIDCEGPQLHLVDYGCIKPPPAQKLSDRYLTLFNGMQEILSKHEPDILVVETQFVNNRQEKANFQSYIKMGMARGIIVLAGKLKGLPVHEYAPRKAKQAVVGNGSASKQQVSEMVRLLLKLKVVPKPEDASDALALAICHALGLKFQQLCPSEI